MPKYKKLGWSDGDILCPFYISQDRKERLIRCEGFAEGAVMTSKFPNVRSREGHMGRHCAAEYRGCPLYKCVYEAKYHD